MIITCNLASFTKGLIKLTNDRDESVEADVNIREKGFDPVESVHLLITPAEAKPFTCHILFPEIVADVLPRSIRLNCDVISTGTNLVIDAADREGPCAALPFFRDGQWCQGSTSLDMTRAYMVWKEKRQRPLVAPLRLKYLLAISTEGRPIELELSGLELTY